MNGLKNIAYLVILLPAVFGMILVAASCGVSDEFTLEVLEPHGELAFTERQGLFAPRLDDLNGKPSSELPQTIL